MEEAGGTPEPNDEQAGDDGRSDGRTLVIVGIVLLVGLVGLLSWVAGGDDVAERVERADERFPPETTVESSAAPTVPVTSAPPATTITPTTVAPTTTVATAAPASTVAPGPTTAVPTTAVPTTVTAGQDIAELVPSVAAFAQPLATPEAVRAQIAALLGAPRHDVASAGAVSSLCAIVTLDGPLAAEGRWERDGRRVAATDLANHDTPGFGDCVGNGGDVLDDGSYQYIAVDAVGAESAAGGFVVGAPRVDQRFTNDGGEPVCGIRIAPRTSRYFEAYVFDAQPIAPGAGVTLPVAAVDQDVEVTSCGGGDVLASFDFEPDASQPRPLR